MTLQEIYNFKAEVLSEFLKKRNGKEWNTKGDPCNPKTEKFYFGENKSTFQMYAMLKGKAPNFMGYAHVVGAGGSIKKNAKPVYGTLNEIVYIDKTEEIDVTAKVEKMIEKGEEIPPHYKAVKKAKGFKVYHISDIQDLPDHYYEPHINRKIEPKKSIEDKIIDRATSAGLRVMQTAEVDKVGINWQENVLILPQLKGKDPQKAQLLATQLLAKAMIEKQMAKNKQISDIELENNSAFQLGKSFLNADINKSLGLSSEISLPKTSVEQIISELGTKPTVYENGVRMASIAQWQIKKNLEKKRERTTEIKEERKSKDIEISR